ncbi:MAG: DNA primase [Desulfobacterales bacterium]|nr:DNA primase [Desulfobacterales bacterium]
MANFIPDDTIAEIRHAVDIAEVISETVLLRKAGKNLVGLCPFHAEKTPSFSVSPEKQIFHCFGCGSGGDVFGFVMKRDGVSFVEAVRALAQRSGIAIPERELNPDDQRRLKERDSLFEINRLALEFFCDALRRDPAGPAALGYLSRREISSRAVEAFQLGYAPKGWDTLLGFMAKRRIAPAMVEKAGLAVPRKDRSGYYDRFRDRLMFPICDESGRVVGFGGRVMDDSTPKYLNSPETPIYTKRRVLYGLQRAKDRCRALGSAYIVEGYLDLISLHQAGIDNTVATLGTALTPDHIRLLTRYAARMVLVYDSDDAGIRSAQRCVELFWKEHADFRRGDVFREDQADTRILVLPEGHDPDSFVRRHGAEAFQGLASAAPGMVSFLAETAVKRHGLSTEGRIRVVGELMGPLSAVNDPVAQAFYVQQLAERLDVSEAVIREGLARRRPPAAQSAADAPARPPGGSAGVERFERRIVTMMLQFPEMIPEILERRILECFTDGPMKRLAADIIAGGHRAGTPVADLLSRVEDAGRRQQLAEIAMSDEVWEAKGCRTLLNRFVESRRKKAVRRSLQQEIEAAEKGRNEAEVMRLLSEKQKLAARRVGPRAPVAPER